MDKLTQEFIIAIDKNVNLTVLKDMVSQGANVNEKIKLGDGKEVSILQYAIDKGVYWAVLKEMVIAGFDFDFHANEMSKNTKGFQKMTQEEKTQSLNDYKNLLVNKVFEPIYDDEIQWNLLLRKNQQAIKFNKFLQKYSDKKDEVLKMLKDFKNTSKIELAQVLQEMKNESSFPENQELGHNDDRKIYSKNFLLNIINFKKNDLILEKIQPKELPDVIQYLAVKEYSRLNEQNPEEYPMNNFIEKRIQDISEKAPGIEEYFDVLDLRNRLFRFDSQNSIENSQDPNVNLP
jgi:hypothetical protein